MVRQLVILTNHICRHGLSCCVVVINNRSFNAVEVHVLGMAVRWITLQHSHKFHVNMYTAAAEGW